MHYIAGRGSHIEVVVVVIVIAVVIIVAAFILLGVIGARIAVCCVAIQIFCATSEQRQAKRASSTPHTGSRQTNATPLSNTHTHTKRTHCCET
jgi:type II secretory pathway pseudopilin PulG